LLIYQPITANGTLLGQSNDPSSLVKVSMEESLKRGNKAITDKFTNGIMGAASAAAAQLAYGHSPQKVKTSGSSDDPKSSMSAPTVSEEKYNEANLSMFGSISPMTNKKVKDARGNWVDSDKIVTWNKTGTNGKTVPAEWSDPSVIEESTKKFLEMPRDKKVAMMGKGSYWKTLGIIHGLGTGHNDRLEFDNRFVDMVGTQLQRNLGNVYNDVAKEVIRNNIKYFQENAIMGNGEGNYTPEDLVNAMSKNISQEAFIQTYTPKR